MPDSTEPLVPVVLAALRRLGATRDGAALTVKQLRRLDEDLAREHPARVGAALSRAQYAGDVHGVDYRDRPDYRSGAEAWALGPAPWHGRS